MGQDEPVGGAPMKPGQDPGWESYCVTVLEFGAPNWLRIDLAQEVGRSAQRELGERGLTPCGIVTACNPRGQRSSPEQNEARAVDAERELAARGVSFVRADGVSPDGNHRERGVALRLPKEEVVTLARAWEQSAIYWWDGRYFWIEPVLVESPPILLPVRTR